MMDASEAFWNHKCQVVMTKDGAIEENHVTCGDGLNKNIVASYIYTLKQLLAYLVWKKRTDPSKKEDTQTKKLLF